MKTLGSVIMMLIAWVSVSYAGGETDLQDYELSRTAEDLLSEYERLQSDVFMRMDVHPEQSRVLEDAQEWRVRSDELRGDPPAYYYFRARIEYDTYSRLLDTSDSDAVAILDRAVEYIDMFARQNVAFADGHALHGAILGRKIAANPASALLLAGHAKGANIRALRLDPDNQMANLNLGYFFASTPDAFGGDRKLAVKHFSKAFENGEIVMRVVAGVRLSITYDQLGDSARAIEVIQRVLELAPGFPQAEATARALADGIDPVVYWEQVRSDGPRN